MAEMDKNSVFAVAMLLAARARGEEIVVTEEAIHRAQTGEYEIALTPIEANEPSSKLTLIDRDVHEDT